MEVKTDCAFRCFRYDLNRHYLNSEEGKKSLEKMKEAYINIEKFRSRILELGLTYFQTTIFEPEKFGLPDSILVLGRYSDLPEIRWTPTPKTLDGVINVLLKGIGLQQFYVQRDNYDMYTMLNIPKEED